MYHLALEYDISPLLFDELTPGEVVDVIDAKVKKERDRLKFNALSKYVQSQQIVEHIAVLIDKSNADKITPIWDFYPSLFQDEKKHMEEANDQKQLESFKERRRMYAANHNKKFGGGNG